MTAAAVELCNQALRLLGDTAITSFDEGTDLAATCSTLYGETARAALQSYPWRWTLAKARLARLADAPASEWTHQHALPPDRLTLRQLFPSAAPGAAAVQDYELFGDRVLSHAPDLWADYQRETDPETWPPAFRLLMRYALAAELAVPVTSSTTQADYWTRAAYGSPAEARGGGQMRVCRQLDSAQQPPQIISDYPLIRARLGGW